MKPKKASGVNIPEAQRGTVAIKLRVPPEVAEELDDLAERWGLTRSGAVGRLVEEAMAPVEWNEPPKVRPGFLGEVIGAAQHKSPANLRNDSEGNER